MGIKATTALWQNYHDWSRHRGELVADILGEFLPLEDASILDAGCGTGGIALALADQGAKVTAIDIRLSSHPQAPGVRWQTVQIEDVKELLCYDAVILWDVLEHLDHGERALAAIQRALNPGGWLLIATPNRHSLFNAFCDPHYGLPLISLCSRKTVRRVVAQWLGWHDVDKPDFPELLSLQELAGQLERAGFSWQFIHKTVLAKALANPRGLWNRAAHLKIINSLKRYKIDYFLRRMVNDQNGFTNQWLMPTFFILARKK